jgi:hypothetical protein
MILQGQFNTPALVAGQFANIRVDASGAIVFAPSTGSGSAPSRTTQLSTDPDILVKGTPGSVLSVSCLNLNTTKRYLLLFNQILAPVLTDVPILAFPIAPASATTDAMTLIGSDFFTTAGIYFSLGIAMGFSTTLTTYTAGAAADQVMQIVYV